MRERQTACGHMRGYRCLCHPLASKSCSTGDLTDYFKRPVGQRLARGTDEEFNEGRFIEEEE